MGDGNLMAFISEDDFPYLHSSLSHFRTEVTNYVSSDKFENSIYKTLNILQSAREALKIQADNFLDGKSYKELSLEMFIGDSSSEKTNLNNIVMQILRSYDFMFSATLCFTLNSQEVEGLLQNIGVNQQTIGKIMQANSVSMAVEEIAKVGLMDAIEGKKIIKPNLQALMKEINKESQSYYRNKSSQYKKDIARILKKKARSGIDWQKFYLNGAGKYKGVRQDIQDRAYSQGYNKNNPEDVKEVEDYCNKYEVVFVNTMKKVNTSTLANVAGAAGEELLETVLDEQALQLRFINVGELSEDALLQTAQAKGLKNVEAMSHRGSGRQSGSDWLITNAKGYTVRAQAKNSSDIIKEYKQGILNRPHLLKVQDGVKYFTTKKQIREMKGSGQRLDDEEWRVLDYLIANYAYFNANRDSSSGSSSIKDIKRIISNLLSVEFGYFLGVSFDDISQVIADKAVSNVFYIIDNAVFYPTYLILDKIIAHLHVAKELMSILRVDIDSNLSFGKKELKKAKQQVQQSTDYDGNIYGSAMLAVGRQFGHQALLDTNISVNVIIDIKTILDEFYTDLGKSLL